MSTVREATFELLRARGMTTIFGNPGSTELPMLGRLPRRLPLRARACRRRSSSAWPTATRRRSGRVDPRQPAHRARASATRWARSSTRRRTRRRCSSRPASRCAPHDHDAGEPDQPRRHRGAAAVRQVELRAAARRRTCRRARAGDPPRVAAARAARRSSRSRWTTGRRGRRRRRSRTRSRAAVDGRAQPRPRGGSRALAARLARRRATRCSSPGPTSTRRGGWDAAVALAERQRLPVWATPADRRRPARLPRGPPRLPGHPAAGDRPGSGRRSPATTSCSSPAPRCSPTTPTSPATLLPEGAELVAITSDPDEAARAPMGEAIVADVALTLRALARAELGESDRAAARAARARARPPRPSRRAAQRRRGDARALAERASPTDGIVVLESPSSTLALRNQLRLSRPGSLLLRRRRRPRLRPLGGGRRAARPARPPGRLRARRGLGAVRDHRASGRPPPTRCRSRSSCCATTSTRSSSGSPSSSRSRARPGSTCPALDVAAIAQRLRRARRSERRAAATSCATALDEALAAQDGPRLVAGRRRAAACALV